MLYLQQGGGGRKFYKIPFLGGRGKRGIRARERGKERGEERGEKVGGGKFSL